MPTTPTVVRRIAVVCAVLGLLAVAFWCGRSTGFHTATTQATRQQAKRDLALHDRLVELDRSLFAQVAASPNKMTSGRYTLETSLAGTTTAASVDLDLVDGQLRRITSLHVQDIQQTGTVVSWEQFPGADADEGPSARYVGVIDGDEMWGRVYVKPGEGWHEGTPPAYGVWRLYRTSL